jgi:hypothetical protein
VWWWRRRRRRRRRRSHGSSISRKSIRVATSPLESGRLQKLHSLAPTPLLI